MGGHMHGELAAGITVETFVESFSWHANSRIVDPGEFLQGTMRSAHERIMKFPYVKNMGGFPGTTCVAALIQDGKIYWGHAGDSRLYLLRDGAVLARTYDHSVVQHWVESGKLTVEESRVHPQRNQITNCLGGVEDIFRMEFGKPTALKDGDVVLLCSDGLWGPFTDRELVESFFAFPVEIILDNLIDLALRREEGHSDNVTGLAVRWGTGEVAHNASSPVSHVLEIV
jgi:serine/threonine protein phosphatase PrpC